MEPDDACGGIGLLILVITFAGFLYTAYRYGYRKGRQSVLLDERQRGFSVLPPVAKGKSPESKQGPSIQ
jgi:hypothetical protein